MDIHLLDTWRLAQIDAWVLVMTDSSDSVCTPQQIVTHIWGYSDEGETSLIKAHIRHLRQKIEPDPTTPTYIRTVPGVGYSLVRLGPDEEKYSAKEVTRALRVVSRELA